MGNYCGGYNYGWQGGQGPSYGSGNGSMFVLIVVLFILLIIVGSVIV
ncbi:YjcZ family sporulation protein [Lysinibacillus sp. KU-BSD001]